MTLQGEIYTRDIIPNLDLLDTNRAEIVSASWLQPVTTNYTIGETDHIIYNGIRNGDRKVVVFTGVKNLQNTLYAETITFGTNSATIGIESVQSLLSSSTDDTGGIKMFNQAYTYKVNDSLKIQIRPNAAGVGKQDMLLFLGFVQTQAGVFD